ETGGTGLGLSIVKHGAELHHARVQLSSKPGKGTTMTVTFPRSHQSS
ncbi:MAG: ATP-binding protein, partial [Christensenellales bacterium]